MKNTVSQKQFRGKAPQQPVDEWNRSYSKEPNPPSKARNGIQLGSASQARPGLAALIDSHHKKRGK